MFGQKKTIEHLDGGAIASLVQTQYDLDWYKGACASRLHNIPAIYTPMRDAEKKRPAFFFGLYANHEGSLGRLLGARQFQYRSEYVLSGWVLKLSETEQLVVLSGKGFGTSFEVAGYDGKSFPHKISDDAARLLNQVVFSFNEILGGPVRKKMEDRHSTMDR